MRRLGPDLNELFVLVEEVRRRPGRPRWTTRIWDIDPVVVERLAAGHHQGDSSSAERVMATQICAGQGVTNSETARRLGISRRTVERYRATLKAAA